MGVIAYYSVKICPCFNPYINAYTKVIQLTKFPLWYSLHYTNSYLYCNLWNIDNINNENYQN